MEFRDSVWDPFYAHRLAAVHPAAPYDSRVGTGVVGSARRGRSPMPLMGVFASDRATAAWSFKRARVTGSCRPGSPSRASPAYASGGASTSSTGSATCASTAPLGIGWRSGSQHQGSYTYAHLLHVLSLFRLAIGSAEIRFRLANTDNHAFWNSWM
jgi:hypothetical protein